MDSLHSFILNLVCWLLVLSMFLELFVISFLNLLLCYTPHNFFSSVTEPFNSSSISNITFSTLVEFYQFSFPGAFAINSSTNDQSHFIFCFRPSMFSFFQNSAYPIYRPVSLKFSSTLITSLNIQTSTVYPRSQIPFFTLLRGMITSSSTFILWIQAHGEQNSVL